MSMLFKRIKDWETSITAFRTGDYIAVDGPSGTAKMGKDDLLRETAENSVKSGIAGSGDVTKIIGEDVVDNYYSDEVTIAEDGKYVASNSSVVTDANFAISDSITLDDGETLQIIAGGYMTYVAMISLYDSGTDTYTRLVQSDGSDRKLYSYKNTTGSSMTIRLSYTKSKKPYIYVKGIPNALLKAHEELNIKSFSEIKDYEDIVGAELIEDYTSGAVTIAEDNKYVASNGSVSVSSGFAISDSITLRSGETIKFLAGGYLTYVAMISSYDSGTDTYTRLVQSEGSDRKLYSYTNTTGSSMIIRLSYSKERKPFIFIKGVIDNSELLPELSMFESLGVIGDSYASGIIYTPDGSNFDTFYNKSWPQVLGRKNGINVTNYSFGGARTNTWLTNASYGLPKMLGDPALDAYAIVLSINDRIKGGAGWLGTIADIHVGDPSLNANSFYGCYAKIIENILTHAPNAKIFCVQHAYNATGLAKDYNDAIADIASLYGIPCIPQFEDEFFTTDVYTQMYGGHPTYIGYAGMADAMCRLIRKSMVKYLSYFKEYLPIT